VSFLVLTTSLVINPNKRDAAVHDLPLRHVTASFGRQLYDITGSLVLSYPLDLCSNNSIRHFPETMYGKIVFALRGSCTFSTKVNNAAQKGAIGVIIGNDNQLNRDETVIMSSTYPVPDVRIPVVGVSYNSYVSLHSYFLFFRTQKLNITVRMTSFENPQIDGFSTGQPHNRPYLSSTGGHPHNDGKNGDNSNSDINRKEGGGRGHPGGAILLSVAIFLVGFALGRCCHKRGRFRRWREMMMARRGGNNYNQLEQAQPQPAAQQLQPVQPENQSQISNIPVAIPVAHPQIQSNLPLYPTLHVPQSASHFYNPENQNRDQRLLI